ncbi:OmpA family protein [Vibrio sp. WXL103]|uniref:OmpA family protein n=1 Tax=Vibrio sp. WXL103 TaxID=3450710 RepID=UPI003EC8347E
MTKNNNLCELKSRYYLLSSYFPVERKDGDITVFKDIHTQKDCRDDHLVSNVKPICLTPVLANVENSSVLWGTNEFGALYNISLTNNIIKDTKGVDTVNEEETDLFSHSCPIVIPKDDSEYELNLPPLSLIGQLAQNFTDEKELCSKLNELANQIQNKTTALKAPDRVNFKLTKVSINQLAKPYKEKPGEPLSDEQLDYNDWHNSLTSDGIEEIEGFIIPSISSIGVVFSSDLYIGAEVTLIKPGKVDQELAKGTVVRPNPFAIEDEESRLTQPSVVFNLDPSSVEDGYYLIRVEFWTESYIRRQTMELANEKTISFPQSIETGRLELIRDMVREGVNERQDVYRYQLHEKLTFKDVSGSGKLALVCGDLISLEESLIYQFPEHLPSYDDYMAEQGKPVARQQNNLSSLNLVSAIEKSAKNYVIGLSDSSNSYDGIGKSMMQSVAKGIWDNLEHDKLPKAFRASASFAYGLPSVKSAWTDFTNSLQPPKGGLQIFNLEGLVKKHFYDKHKASRLMQHMGTAINNSGHKSVSKRIAKSWFRGRTMQRFNEALPIINTAIGVNQFYTLLDNGRDIRQTGDYIQQDFDKLSKSYFENIINLTETQSEIFTQDWCTEAFSVKNSLNSLCSKPKANLVTEPEHNGLTLTINFNFNSWETPNSQSDSDSDSELTDVASNLATLLIENPNYRLLIEGHACPVGSEDNNLKVSALRASEIKQWIVNAASEQSDIENRIFESAYGSSVRLSSNNSAAEREKDRRVELRLVIPSYKLSLPPSRTAMIAMENIRQSKFGNIQARIKNNTEVASSMLDVFCNVATFTPLAPMARGVLVVKSVSNQIVNASEAIEAILFKDTYKQFKDMSKNRFDLARLGAIHSSCYREYLKLLSEDVKLEKVIEDTEQFSTYVNNLKNVRELQRRFLQRSMALNGLMEIFAYIAVEVKSNPSKNKSHKELLEEYRVQDYINSFVLSDSWVPVPSNNGSMGRHWVNMAKHANSKIPGLSDTMSVDRVIERTREGSRLEGFSVGFPIHACLYMDKEDYGFEEFSKNFDNNVVTVKKEHIGLTRLLICEPSSNGKESWKAYDDWCKDGASNRISPFTKLKVQIVLNHKALSELKTIFKAKLGYSINRPFKDIKGPQFDLLMVTQSISDLTQCGDNDTQLSTYFQKELAKISEEDRIHGLVAAEFEPSYWFGNIEISGLKPFFQFRNWQTFKHWKREGLYRENSYYLEINNIKINLNSSDIPRNNYILSKEKEKHEKISERREEIKAIEKELESNSTEHNGFIDEERAIKEAEITSRRQHINRLLKEIEFAKHHFNFGVSDDNSADSESQSLSVYDALGNKKVTLSETDLLIESFVTSASAEKEVNVTPYATGDIRAFAALEIDGEFEMFSRPSESTRKSKNFSWANEPNRSAIYVALFADDDNSEEYLKQDIDINSIFVSLQLSIKEKNSFLGFRKDNEGPILNGQLQHLYDINYGIEIKDLTGADETPTYVNITSQKTGNELRSRNSEVSKTIDNFADIALKAVMDKPEAYLNVGKRQRKLFVARFELWYVSPTGKDVKGLRPFGPIFGSPKGAECPIYPSELRLDSLMQQGVNKDDSKYIKSEHTLELSSSDTYDSPNLPWQKVENDKTKVNVHAKAQWEKVLEEGDAQRREWLERWVKDKDFRKTLSAPLSRGDLNS